LKLESIDFETDKIHIVQQKTGEPLELPLRAIVGNAIYDYVMLERPKCSESALFLLPHNRPVKAPTLSAVANRIMNATGIRQGKGQRKGIHIFRFHLATRLLENEVPQPIISNSLGHAHPASVEAYVIADLAHLKTCALGIDRFPVAEGVLR
jgi:integrase